MGRYWSALCRQRRPWYDRSRSDDAPETPVSLGYDRIRFLGPVFIGDTITVAYRVVEIDVEKRRSLADVTVTNENDETLAVAQHILKWIPRTT